MHSVPIVCGPRSYAALQDLTTRLGLVVFGGYVSSYGVLVVRLESAHAVETVADDGDTGVGEIDGTYYCTRPIGGQITRFEATQ